MTAAVESLYKTSLFLPPDQRLSLARDLIDSVDAEPEPNAEAKSLWEKEIARRMEQYDSGQVTAVPAQTVFDRLKQIAP